MIVWLASYPKSGNTLLRSLLSSYFFSNDGDFKFNHLYKISQFPAVHHFTSLGIKRFINDLKLAPISLTSQVIYSFHLYEKKIEEKYGKNFLWLLYPEDNQLFNDFMKNKIHPEHLNYNFKNRKYLSKN